MNIQWRLKQQSRVHINVEQVKLLMVSLNTVYVVVKEFVLLIQMLDLFAVYVIKDGLEPQNTSNPASSLSTSNPTASVPGTPQPTANDGATPSPDAANPSGNPNATPSPSESGKSLSPTEGSGSTNEPSRYPTLGVIVERINVTVQIHDGNKSDSSGMGTGGIVTIIILIVVIIVFIVCGYLGYKKFKQREEIIKAELIEYKTMSNEEKHDLTANKAGVTQFTSIDDHIVRGEDEDDD